MQCVGVISLHYVAGGAADQHPPQHDGQGELFRVVEIDQRVEEVVPDCDGDKEGDGRQDRFGQGHDDLQQDAKVAVWCLPFKSILDYEKMLRPEEQPEYLDFARRLLAMRVNNLGLFAQYAARGSQFERWLARAEPVEQFARFLDRFGVTVGLSLHYAEPDENGDYADVCPFSDAVRAQWHDFAARLAVTMPSVRNAIVWGAGENAPGPHEDDCDRCRALPVRQRILAGMRLVSDALATIDGALLWPAVTDQAAYAKSETELFGDWGDELPENVRIAPCHLYWDFRPPYPPHPIWGHIGNRQGERAPYVFELALVGDTAG